tara:strand:+ start:1143 stop:2000 length:858 start_codon:yes stop_codon:yes gene_type:complete
MIKLTNILIEQIINGAPSLKKVKKVKKSLTTDRDYVYKPVREQDTYEMDQQITKSKKMPIVQRIALINQIRKMLGEQKTLDKIKQFAKDNLPFITPTDEFETDSEAFRDDIKKVVKIATPTHIKATKDLYDLVAPKVKKYMKKDIEEGSIQGFHTIKENGIAKINGHEMGVEIQSTPEGLQKGLMFRKEIPSGKGMLMKFGKDQPANIWMKNVKQPLDIIYIKDDKVIDLFKNAMPDMGDGTFDSIGEVICDMVLELPAGDIDKFDIKPGDMFGFNDLRKTNINQ